MASKASLIVLAGAAVIGAFYAGPMVWPDLKPRRDALVESYPVLAKLPGIEAPAAKPAAEGQAGQAPRGPAQQAQGGRPGAPGQGGGRPAVPVITAKAARQPMPVRFDTIGTVQPIAAVTLRSRVESQVLAVNFEDGASVNQGDILFNLDSRQIEAQIKQAEANLSRSRAQLDQAQRDVRRNEALAANEYASRQKLDDSRTAVLTVSAQIRSDEAVLENLNVQLSYYTIKAPISGRIGVAGVKVGNIAKTGDNSTPLATINQISPIYVTFAVPQRLLPELRTALNEGTSKVQATPQGLTEAVDGKIAVIENAVDAASGTIQLRGVFENADNVLWPGALCDVRLVIRTEPDAVVVPREAVQTSQNGQIVFTVADGVAKVQPVVVDRTLRGLSVIKSGLNGDETVVTDGQLLLTNGARVEQRPNGGGGGGGGGAGGRGNGAGQPGTPSAGAPAAPGASPQTGSAAGAPTKGAS
ncbi:efflux RND transporter periplasmic adaptor subunit [Alsobacter sp. SYSU M60028]|uniref:Efflux RND transporter periplasmic adaptor subunit n=1 Tax=Alsobacter ponti TaxID=2962936 RepID=A0ABT1LCU3_9HYPH|nr:efflux RND transporter periplasmic adaptor subunit [Alsobacter ponti]MCP8939331.1 efflux RND transporter periplasmic adaptor subunit [Alsobacter ponti]